VLRGLSLQGRSLGHLLMSLLATLFFTLAFYWLVAPHAPFGTYYALFLLT
jgi:hypothetical protein